MNKIYKVIWSKVKGCYVVTSELAKRNRKSSSSHISVASVGSLTAAIILSLGLGSSVYADSWYDSSNYPAANNKVIATGRINTNSNIAMANTVWLNPMEFNTAEHKGQPTPNNTIDNTSVEPGGADLASNNAQGSVVIGYGSAFSDNPFGINGPATYENANQSGQGTAVGSDVFTTAQATALGNNVYAIGRSSIALGSDDIKTYRNQISSYDFEHYFKALYSKIDPSGRIYGYGTDSDKPTSWDPNITYNAAQSGYSPTLAQGDGAIAIGSRSLAYASGSTALGTLAFALRPGSTAVGTQTRSEGEGSIALGNNTSVFADNSVGTGNNIQIINKGGMAFGYESYSGGLNSLAVGSHVYSNTAMTFSDDLTQQVNKPFLTGVKGGLLFSSLGGNAENASGGAVDAAYLNKLEQIVTDGSTFQTTTKTVNGVKNVVTQSGNNSIVVGSYSAALGDNALALGHGSFALDKNNFAIGSFAYANSPNAMAIGLTSRAMAENSLALGVGTGVSSNGNDSIAIGTGSVNYASQSALVGNKSRIWNGSSALIFGTNTQIAGDGNIGLGNNIYIASPLNTEGVYADRSRTGSQRNIALGNKVTIGNGVMESLAIGTDATIGNKDSSNNGIAHAVAIGFNATVTSGTGEMKTGVNSMAIGSGAQADLVNSIALGTNSKTDYTSADLNLKPWVMPGAIGIPSASNIGVVSVGAQNYERRIVNVASGAKDTDAVNVGQLKTVTEKLTDDIDMLKNGTGTNYMSLQTGKAKSLEMSNKVNSLKNYTQYVVLSEKLLTYQARQTLNGEQFNQAALEPLKKRVEQLAQQYPNFATIAKQLVDIKVTPGGNFEDTMQQIQTAFQATRVMDSEGNIVNGALAKQITGITAEQLESEELDTNYNNKGAQGADSLAFGYGAGTDASAANTVAIGYDAKANGTSSVALGDTAIVNKGADNSVAIGHTATVQANATNAVALGNGASAGQPSAVAIGNGATVSAENSVAIGAGSTAGSNTGAGELFGGAYASLTAATLTPVKGEVSIGSASNTRRLTNLAAGMADTDAVNVAQLKDLANNKIYLSDGNNHFTSGVTLGANTSSADKRIILPISGDADISSTVQGEGLSLSLNKGNVATAETKAVSGQSVYNAILNAKPTVNGDTIVKVNKTAGSGIQGDTFTVSLDKSALKDEVAKNFAYADASNVTPETWRTKLDVYSKDEANTAIAKAKTEVKAGSTNTIAVTELSQDPSVYTLDLSSDIKSKLDNLPANTNEELSKKADTATVNQDVQNITNALKGKADEDLHNVTATGQNFVKDWAISAVTVTAADNKVVVKPVKDANNHSVDYTVTVDESKFNPATIKSLVGGVTSSVDDTTALPTSAAVKSYVGSQVSGLSSAGLKIDADSGGPITAELGKKVAIDGNNGITTAVATDSANGAKLTIGLDTTTKNKIDNALAQDGSNVGANKDTLLKNLGLDAGSLGNTYAKVDGSNITDPANQRNFRTNIDVYSKEDTNTAIENASSKVAVAQGSGLTVSSSQVNSAGPTTYTLGFDSALANKLANLPANVSQALGEKADKSALTNLADRSLSNLEPAGNSVIQQAAIKAVQVQLPSTEKALQLTANTQGDVKTYTLSLDPSKLDATAIKNLIGGVSSTIPADGTSDNAVTTVGAVKSFVSTLETNGIGVTSNDSAGPKTLALGKTLTVKGDGTFITGQTTAANGGVQVNLGLASDIQTKLNNLPSDTNALLNKTANQDMNNLSDTGKSAVKDLANSAVNVVGDGNKLTVSTNTADHVKTFTLSLDESNFDANKIKTLLGGVADSVPTTGVAAGDSGKLATLGAAQDIANNLASKGLVFAGNSGTATAQLGKQVKIEGDGTYLTSTAAADSDHGSTVSFSLTSEAQQKLDNALAKDGSNVEGTDLTKLQTKLGINNLATEYAKADASNISAAPWLTKLGVSTTQQMNDAIAQASSKVVGSGYVTVKSTPSLQGTTYTVGLSDEINQKFQNLSQSTSTGLDGKANVDLKNISDVGKNVVKDLAAQAVTVGSSDQSVTVTKTTDNHVTNYDVKLDNAKVKAAIGGVSDTIDGTNATNDSTIPTAGGVKSYVGSQLSSLKSTGFTVASNVGAAQTQALANTFTVKGDNTSIVGTVSGGSGASTVTLGLKSDVLSKINGAVQDTDYKQANNINADAWKTALGVSNLNFNYKANGLNGLTVPLSTGLNFVNGTNTTATVKADGYVSFDINPSLKNINSITSSQGVSMTLNGTTATFSTKKSDGNQKGDVRLKGVLYGSDDDDAVNVAQLNQLRSEVFGTDVPKHTGTTGGAEPGHGELNHTGNAGHLPVNINDRVNTLLNGLAGNMVYTAPNGERLDYDPTSGHFFRLGDPQKTAVAMKDIVISAVSAQDGMTTTPTLINNVASGLGLTGTYVDGDGGNAGSPATITPIAAHTAIDNLLAMQHYQLNRAASIGDLQAVAQAGNDLVANSDNHGNTEDSQRHIHMPIGSKLTVLGGETNAYTAANYDSDNLVTYIDQEGSTPSHRIMRLAFKSTPDFSAVKLGAAGKQVTLTPNSDGTSLALGSTVPSANGVTLTGLKDGTTADSAVTKGALDAVKSALGLTGATGATGATGNTGDQGPAGKDGLNNASMIGQIAAQRAGTSGNMVYTDKDGNRLVNVDGKYYKAQAGMVQGKDGKWYINKDQLDAMGNPISGAHQVPFGSAIPSSQVSISAVNADGTTTAPIALDNVGSGLGLSGKPDNSADATGASATNPAAIQAGAAQAVVAGPSKDGNGGLLTATGAALNKAANIGDLQAVAQAGLDVTANSDNTGAATNKTIHLPLGTAFSIIGDAGATYNANADSAENIVTMADGKTVTVAMKKAPRFDSVKVGSGDTAVTMAPGTNGGLQLSTGQGGTGKVALTGLADSTAGDSAVTRALFDSLVNKLGVDGVGSAGGAGAQGAQGPAGHDGLNGTTQSQKVDALRNGVAGNTVYTNKDGDRLTFDNGKFYSTKGLTRANNGKWYQASDVEANGQPKSTANPVSFDPSQAVPTSDIVVSTVNPEGSTTTPVAVGNVGSALGLTGNATNTAVAPSAEPGAVGPANPAAIEAAAAQKAIAGPNMDGKGGLLAQSGKALTQATSLGDLQAVAQAGLNYVANSDANGVANKGTVHSPLGTSLAIKGDAGATYSADNYSSTNLVTYAVPASDSNATPSIVVALKQAPQFKALNLNDGQSGSKTLSLTPDANGNLKLANGTDGAPGANDVVISGIKDGSTPDSVATKGALDAVKQFLGMNGAAGNTGSTGESGATGPAGKDGLNGATMSDKIEAQRNGLSGNMVYTDKQGNRLVKIGDSYYPQTVLNGLKKANDGKYYPQAQVKADGTTVPNAQPTDIAQQFSAQKVAPQDMAIAAVNPDGSTTAPVNINNVASGLGLTGTSDNKAVVGGPEAVAAAAANPQAIAAEAAQTAVAGSAKDGNGGLLAANGKALTKAANVGDLQAVAQAGLTFTSNQQNSTVHRPLGTSLGIVGDSTNTDASNFSASNVMTTVDSSNNAIVVNIAKAPSFEALSLKGANGTQAISLTPSAAGDSLTVAGASGGVELKGLKASNDANAAATVGQIDALKSSLGLGSTLSGAAGSQGQQGPAGKDGLDGKSILQKVQGIRNGMTGSMVYTTEDGSRVTRIGDQFYKTSDIAGKTLASDGKWYPSAEVGANGQVIGQPTDGVNVQPLSAETPLAVSAVDPRTGETTGAPVAIEHVASGLGITATEEPVSAQAAKKYIVDSGNARQPALLQQTGAAALQRAASIADLQALAQAGMDFSTNPTAGAVNGSNVIHKTAGAVVAIEGKSGASYDSTAYGTDNLTTFVDTTSATNPVIRVAFKDNPTFKGLNLQPSDGTKPAVTITPGADGDSLSLGNTQHPSKKVSISGVKQGTTPDSVATQGEVDKLNDALGLNGKDGATGPAGIAGKNGATGPASKDGLNGTPMVTQIQSLRDGTAGSMVYTNQAGKRLAKVGNSYYTVDGLKQAKNGQWYPANQVNADGTTAAGAQAHDFSTDTAVPMNQIMASAVNPDGTTTNPTPLGNVASALGLPGSYSAGGSNTPSNPAAISADAAIKAVAGTPNTAGGTTGGLLQMSGPALNRATTLGDLQAVAQAGLTVKGTLPTATGGATAIHLPLGSTFTIQGSTASANKVADFASDNLITSVDMAGKTINLGFKKTPSFDGLILGPGPKRVQVSTDSEGNVVLLGKNPSQAGANNDVVVKGIAEGDTPNSVATKGSVDELKNLLGLGSGTTGGSVPASPGPAGKDGLDGKGLIDKIQGIREGMAGTMVYTDSKGDRLTRVGNDFYKTADVGTKVFKDGHWYDSATASAPSTTQPTKLAATEKVLISTVNATDGSTTVPTQLANVASGLGLTGKADNSVGTTQAAATPQPISATAAKTAVVTLLTEKPDVMKLAANLQDLQAVAQAGLDVGANKNANQVGTTNVKHLTLGSAFNIIGDSNANYTSDYDSSNLVTKLDGNNIVVGMKKAPAFTSLNLGESGNTVTLKTGDQGQLLTLSNNTTGTAQAQGVVISGLKAGSTPDSAVTKGELDALKNILGVSPTQTPNTGVSPSNTPSGKDGMDGQSVLNKVEGLRQGTAGSMVYTDTQGDRLVRDGRNFYKLSDLAGLKKANDGKWYKDSDVDRFGNVIIRQGQAAPQPEDLTSKALPASTKVMISAVNPDGATTTPVTVGNVASGLGLTGKADNTVDSTGTAANAPAAINAQAAQAVVAGTSPQDANALVNRSGAALNHIATIGDLQAVAQAGFDVMSNASATGQPGENTIHSTLGQGISIVGGADSYSAADFSADNLVTMADKANRKVTIAMKKTPTFDALKLGNTGDNSTVVLTPGANHSLKFSDGATSPNPITIMGVAPGNTEDSVATKGEVDELKSDLGLKADKGNFTDENTGAAAKDGMNGTSIRNKIEAQRKGTTGNMVYTDEAGNRLINVKGKFYKHDFVVSQGLKLANDGLWYPATSLNADGSVIKGKEDTAYNFNNAQAVDPSDVVISAVSAAGDTKGVGSQTTIANVKSNLVPDDTHTAQQLVAGTDGKSGLLTQTQGLDRAATVGDLKTLATAGIRFAANEKLNQSAGDNVITNALGTQLSIVGKAGAQYDAQDYTADNLVTVADKTSNTITVAMKKLPTFTGTVYEAPGTTTTITVSPSVSHDGNVPSGKENSILTFSNTSTNPMQGTAVTLRGIAPGVAPSDAVNVSQLNSLSSRLGDDDSAVHNPSVPEVSDGLNGNTMSSKIAAQRNGLSGSMVYTDKAGDRLTVIGGKYYSAKDLEDAGYKQANDGKWYPAVNVKDGKAVPNNGVAPQALDPVVNSNALKSFEVKPNDVVVSAVNPTAADKTTTTPIALNNVASGLGLTGTKDNTPDPTGAAALNPQAIDADAATAVLNGVPAAEGQEAKPGLLTLSGSALNRAATVGDLQAVAQGGLNVTATDKAITSHLPLGSTLQIVGKQYDPTVAAAYTAAAASNPSAYPFSDENIYTTVDPLNKVVHIQMSKSPIFDSIRFGSDQGPELTVDKNGKLAIQSPDGKTAPIATSDSGFYVKTDKGKVIFVGMGDTLTMTSLHDDNVYVSSKDGSAPSTTTTSPVVSTNTTTPAPVSTVPNSMNLLETAAPSQANTDNRTPSTQAAGITEDQAKAAQASGDKTVVVSLSKTPTFDSITLKNATTDQSPTNSVVTKGYVDNAVSNVAKIGDTVTQMGNTVTQMGNTINQLGEQMTTVAKNSSAGTASALAAAGLPTVINSNKRQVFSLGMGSYHGESAMAVGVSGTNRNRDVLYKVTGTVDSTGTYGLSAGVSFAFGAQDTYRKGRTIEQASFNERLDKLEALSKEVQELKNENKELRDLVYKKLHITPDDQQQDKANNQSSNQAGTGDTSQAKH